MFEQSQDGEEVSILEEILEEIPLVIPSQENLEIINEKNIIHSLNNLKHNDNIPMNEKNIARLLNNLKHTGNIPNQRVDKPIEGLSGLDIEISLKTKDYNR